MVKDEIDEYQRDAKMILDKLDRLDDSAKDVEKRLQKIETEIALLRLKSSFWGAVAGLASYVATMGIQYLKKG